MLGPILCATVVAPDVGELAPAYCGAFDFQVLADTAVSDGLARSWGRPGLAGTRSVLLGHTVGAPGLIRLLEVDTIAGDRPLLRPGWRSIELCVQDVHRVRERIGTTPFEVVGEPAPIPGVEDISAMQVVGPAGEMLYLTEIADQGVYDLPTATHFVERVFIAVMSAPELGAARSFYEDKFGGQDPAGSITAPIECVNRVLDLPLDIAHTFCAVQFAGQSLVEVDQHPPELVGEADAPAALPRGTAMMTFAADAAAVTGLEPLGPAWNEPAEPYGGRRTLSVAGPGGERIELVGLEV